MLIAFILTMPNKGSWDGKWSGESNLYAVVKKLELEKAQEVFHGSSYHYSWDDGWSANVEARIVSSNEAKKYRKKSQGFCGYEWMVDSIINHGKIMATHERKAAGLIK